MGRDKNLKLRFLALGLSFLMGSCEFLGLDRPEGADTSEDEDISESTQVLPTVYFSTSTSSVDEDVGTTNVTVTLTNAPVDAGNSTASVDYTISGTATGGGTDHDAASGTVTFGETDTTSTIVYTVNDDALDEDAETIIITLTSASGASLSSSVTHTVTINDNDATPSVTFTSASQSSGTESGSMTITAQLSAASGLAVSVPYTVNGSSTATDTTDYSITTSPITISAGSTTSDITITVASDSLDENNETVIVDMGTPTNASQGATTQHTATITDDDASPAVTFDASSTSTSEGDAAYNLSVSIPAAGGLDVTVPFSLGGTATSGTDYSITSTPVTISAGSTSTNITITVTDDALIEDSETAIVTMGVPTNATQGATTVFTMTIPASDSAITVDSCTDASDSSAGDGTCDTGSSICTLRAAIEEANAVTGTQTITLPTGSCTIGLTIGSLSVTETLSITGDSETNSIIDANNSFRVLDLSGGATLTLSNLTLQDGVVNGHGAGIRVTSSSLTTSNVTIKNNSILTTGNHGGGIYATGAASVLTIDNSTIEGNSTVSGTSGQGGGIYVDTDVTFTLTDSTLKSNSSYSGGGIYVHCGPLMTVERNLFDGNDGGQGGGANFFTSRGGTVYNNTITNGTGRYVAGIYSHTDSCAQTLDLRYNTIKNNTANQAVHSGGLWVAGGTTTIAGMIFEDNTMNGGVSEDSCVVNGTLTNNGYNLLDTASGDCGTHANDTYSTASGLGSLQDNGGPTHTYCPTGGSAAIDTGTNLASPTVDQRGFARPGASTYDIGACEIQ